MNESERIKNKLKELATCVRENPNNPKKLSFAWSGGTEKVWTKQVKKRLCKVGHDQGYRVCVEKKLEQAYRSEWLYDMTWLKFDGRELIDVPLVLECEWGYFDEPTKDHYHHDRVQYDFQKLLLAKADLRCIIFAAQNLQDAEKYVEELIDIVERFQKRKIGDNYLFCVCLSAEKRFHFKEYTVNTE
jgi:hypothetical protein